MDPVVRQMFDELLERFDAVRTELDGFGSRLDQRFADSEAVRTQRAAVVDGRLESLERFASDQYTAAIVADNWGGHFSERVADLEERVRNLELVRYVEIQDERDERVAVLETANEAIEAWRPRIESSLFTVRSEVDRLARLWDGSAAAPTNGHPRPAAQHELVAGRASAGSPTDWPRGHGASSTTRESGHGPIVAMAPFPANGTSPVTYPPDPHLMHTHHHPPPPYPPPPPPANPPPPYFQPPPQPQPLYLPPPSSAPSFYPPILQSQPLFNFHPPPQPYPPNHSLGQLPKMLFPQFDGDNPKLWLSRARSHFEMYSVHPSVWVRVATHHFTHAAARWLQSVEAEVRNISWESFSSLILERFSRDQHELLLRQLFHIKHSTSVSDYIEKFTDLYEQLKAYNPNPDKLYFTTRFIDGLRPDIRSVVLVARPQDLDSACSIALLQEEALDPGPRREYKRSEGSVFARHATIKGALPLPPPPRQNPDPPPAGRPGENKVLHPRASPVEDRLSSLRAYRKACGLCVRCGEKWTPGHRCAAVPQLHALQEVWDLCQSEFVEEGETSEPVEHESGQLNLLLSSAAVSAGDSLRTMQFLGYIGGRPVSLLVDSGSSHSFLHSEIASSLSGSRKLSSPLSVRVADGSVIQCSSELPDVEWSVQGYRFHSTLRVLPLGCYDMIIGMDWLEAFSPMKVHWLEKWMSIPYGNTNVLLHGQQSVGGPPVLCQLFQLAELAVGQSAPVLPAPVQDLSEPSELPPRRACDHTIPLVPGASPVAIRQYRYAPKLKDEIEQQVSDMLQSGMIRPSTSPFSSPVLLVRKKDGSWRFCVDYRMLNALTIKAKFPIPVVDELLDELANARWFSCLDLRAGFNQIRLAEGEEYKTAFQTHWGQFEFNVMSFGLTGAPNSFQGAMNSTLKPVLRRCALVFFDDILVYSPTLVAHIDHLRQVLQLLSNDQWRLKRSKCRFAQTSISYLGHVISSAGVATDPSKISDVQNWPVPQDIKQLRSFLGLAGYYRKFVQNFAVIARPLTDLLKKGTLFVWSSSHSSAFDALKAALVSAPVLALPDFSKPFQIQTDACDTGVGAVLMQDNHPLAFVSKALGPRSRGLSTYEKEYLAILVAVDQWRSYLQHAEFTIFTDQRSLMHISDQRLHTPWQMKMYTKLIGLQYRVVYKPGTSNAAADALSRHPSPSGHLLAISSAVPDWLAEVAAGYSSDPAATRLIQELSLNPSAHPPFSLHSGVLRHKGRIWLGQNAPVQLKVIEALHNSAVGGHSGFPVTFGRIKQLFYWPGMKSAVRSFVASCSVCQQAKSDHSKYPGLLLPLPVPTESWQVISMDFIEGLPTSGHANCILVVVDKFSKFAHFVPLHHLFTAAKVAQSFLDSVYRLHGMPSHIISDRDPIFTSLFWKELFKLAQVELCMSSAYHPQSDGQTERVNQCLETYLRCFVHSCPRSWLKWLTLAEYWYNTCHHSALGKSPFEVLYGRLPRHFGITDISVSPVPDVASKLAERNTMLAAVRQHLLRAQQRMKAHADKRRSERSFSVGDFVYLRLQPYVQSSLAPRAHHKLCFKFFGPYEIIEKINPVAYKLKLPEESSIHPVFHVSMLKPASARPSSVSATLPDTDDSIQVPEKILQRRLHHQGARVVPQLLVKWSGMEDSLATWEDEVALLQRFPGAPAWGHAASQGGGDVSTPHPGDPAAAPKPRKSTRPKSKSVRLAGPEWACNACCARPSK